MLAPQDNSLTWLFLASALTLVSCASEETSEKGRVPASFMSDHHQGTSASLTVTGHISSSDDRPPPVKGNVALIREILAACPAWSDVPAGDQDAKSEITKLLRSLAEFEIAELRVALEREVYDGEHSEQGLSTALMSKLYVANRFLFAVPVEDDPDAPCFWGVVVPVSIASACWPVGLDGTGRPELVYDFTIAFGEPYRALDEFDEFSTRYKLRGP